MANQPEFENGRTVGVTYGKRDGHPTAERVKLIVDRQDPDGIWTIGGSGDPIRVPVKVVFAGVFVRDVPPDRPRAETPDLEKALESARETWVKFLPTRKNFEIPLPPLVQE